MSSATDLPHQPNIIQQQPLMEKKSNPVWKIIFILLLIANVMFVFWAGNQLSTRGHTEDLSALGVIFFSLPVAIIDFIAALIYIVKQQPHGITKAISYITLTIVMLVLVYSGVTLMNTFF
jgi:hypothetical protein